MAKTIEEIANSLFGDNESLSKADFLKAVSDKGMKIADLADGDFVTKQKFDDHDAKYKKLKSDYDALKNNPEPDEATKKRIADIEKERDEFKTKFEENQSKVQAQERKGILSSLNVKDDFSDFVMSEVSKAVTDTVDFETSAKKYIAEHQQYVAEGSSNPNSGLKLNSGSKTKDGGVFDDLEDFIRG